jgi:hypothetical protein
MAEADICLTRGQMCRHLDLDFELVLASPRLQNCEK